MKRRLVNLCVAFFVSLVTFAQRPDYPLIGAQVFIEPGQSSEEIETLFKTMSEAGMEVARIRLFGSHIMHLDGSADFSLYDTAFDAAARYGIRLFVTLFPPTNELTDVGGFKHPHSEKHLSQVETYIRTVVSHFASHPALYAWVLQNEPGTGARSVRSNDLSDRIRSQWELRNSAPEDRTGYLRENFRDYKFLRYYDSWYLSWLADKVRECDGAHYLHANPHNLLYLLPEYDFRQYEQFLSSLGVSMHLSWHFLDFSETEYPVGISMMCDIIRERAGTNPFWVTELQGGNVTASGCTPFCPTAKDIEKYLWINVASGAQGTIFWTLNPRKAVMEAGEWALLDYQGEPSDRLSAAAGVAKRIREDKYYRKSPEIIPSALTILYNDESMLIQQRNCDAIKDENHMARSKNAIVKSLIAAYEAASCLGPTPNLVSMDYFDWDPVSHPAVVLPNVISIPVRYHDKLRSYVHGGGKLLVTGLSGYYDEGMRCLMMGEQPFADCFGAQVSEIKVSGDQFKVKCSGRDLPAHLWRGILKPSTADVTGRYGDEVCAVHNRFGDGEVWWIPSLLHLGSVLSGDKKALVSLYEDVFGDELSSAPFRFAAPCRDVLMKVTRSSSGVQRCYLVNLSPSKRSLTLICSGDKKKRITLPADGVILVDTF